MTHLTVRGLSYRYNAINALDGVDLDVKKAAFAPCLAQMGHKNRRCSAC